MSSSDSSGLSFFNWPSIAIFILLSWGVVLLPTPMRSYRPQVTDEEKTETEGPFIDARLWQDPLEVASKFDAKHIAKANELNSPPKLPSALPEWNQTDQLTLGVYLSGGNYPEDRETRLRTRYAVVSALATSGYIPTEGGGLRFAFMHFKTNTTNQPLTLPYEIYKQSESHKYHQEVTGKSNNPLPQRLYNNVPTKIRVIWINDHSLRDQHREKLQQFIAGAEGKSQVAIIGPTSSDSLHELLYPENFDLNQLVSRLTRKIGRRLTAGICMLPESRIDKAVIYSFLATAKDVHLQAPREDFPFKIAHVIGDDEKLAKAMKQELRLRHWQGILPEFTPSWIAGEKLPAIAIVGEWDSTYSRSAFDAFQRVFEDKSDRLVKKLEIFTYQQGIDGRLPGDSASSSGTGQKTGTSSSDGKSTASNDNDFSFGRSQIDYVKRLVGEMKRREPGHWDAIGLLGNDVYDKLMILETLKQEFPDTIFFTTDMDQRYLDPPVRKTTRNLLIASHYGLTLNECLQRQIPPFRSTYQTACYLACLQALYDHHVRLPNSWQSSNDQLSHPLSLTSLFPPQQQDKSSIERDDPAVIFEVGTSIAYPLMVFGDASQSSHWVHPNEVYIPYTNNNIYLLIYILLSIIILICFAVFLVIFRLVILLSNPRTRAIIFFLLALVVSAANFLEDLPGRPLAIVILCSYPVIWLYFSWPKFKDFVDKQWRWLIFGIAVFLGLGLIIWFDHSSQREIFSLHGGISNWPTTLIRAVVLVFSIASLLFLGGYDADNRKDITTEFNIDIRSYEFNCECSEPAAVQVKETQKPADSKTELFLVSTCLVEEKEECSSDEARFPNDDEPGEWLAKFRADKKIMPLVIQDKIVDLKEKLDKKLEESGIAKVEHGKKSKDKKGNEINEAHTAWLFHCVRSKKRGWRIFQQITFYLACCIFLALVVEAPHDPFRGKLNFWTYTLIMLASGIANLVLLWFVIDAHWNCGRLIDHLNGPETVEWPESARSEAAAASNIDYTKLLHTIDYTKLLHTDAITKALNRLTSLTVLADRTSVIGPMIYFPAFSAILMFLARSPIFDQFVLSWYLIAVYSVAIFAMLACGFGLRYFCHKQRDDDVKNVRAMIAECLQRSGRDKQVEDLEKIAEAIGKVQGGAFSTFSSDPVLRTVFMMLGGVGALLSMEPIRQFLQ